MLRLRRLLSIAPAVSGLAMGAPGLADHGLLLGPRRQAFGRAAVPLTFRPRAPSKFITRVQSSSSAITGEATTLKKAVVRHRVPKDAVASDTNAAVTEPVTVPKRRGKAEPAVPKRIKAAAAVKVPRRRKTAPADTASIPPSPSDEQLAIITAVAEGQHVVVDAVAGSGKTTTLLTLALRNPHLRILLVTYNTHLKIETRSKVKAMGLRNVEAHSYHSLVVSYYDKKAYTDDALRRIVKDDTPPLEQLPTPDVIVVDETQDMTVLYFGLLRKFVVDAGVDTVRLLMMGDSAQGIYAFKKADTRFLTLAPNILESLLPGHPVVSLPLTTSYRLTKHMASFLNDVMLGYSRINAVKDGPRVEYIHAECGTPPKFGSKCTDGIAHGLVVKRIMELMTEGIRAEDVFVLTPSDKNFVSTLIENELVARGVPCYLPTKEDKASDAAMRGKLMVSTFHGAKGLERKVVVLLCFDDSYYTYYARDENFASCPAAMYVAATRATQLLLVVDNQSRASLPFVKQSLRAISAMPCVAWRRGAEAYKSTPLAPIKYERAPFHDAAVTELVEYLDDALLARLEAAISPLFSVIHKAGKCAPLPPETKTATGAEEVADLTGLALPAMWESGLRGGDCALLREIRGRRGELGVVDAQRPVLEAALARDAKSGVPSTPTYLLMANMYATVLSQYHFRLAQIGDYGWITDAMAARCLGHLEARVKPAALGAGLSFEVAVKHQAKDLFGPDVGDVDIAGTMDLVDGPNRIVYELKCVGALSVAHKLQLLIYSWLRRRTGVGGGERYRLLNMRNGETLEVRGLDTADGRARVDTAVRALVRRKFGPRTGMADDVFLARATGERRSLLDD